MKNILLVYSGGNRGNALVSIIEYLYTAEINRRRGDISSLFGRINIRNTWARAFGKYGAGMIYFECNDEHAEALVNAFDGLVENELEEYISDACLPVVEYRGGGSADTYPGVRCRVVTPDRVQGLIADGCLIGREAEYINPYLKDFPDVKGLAAASARLPWLLGASISGFDGLLRHPRGEFRRVFDCSFKLMLPAMSGFDLSCYNKTSFRFGRVGLASDLGVRLLCHMWPQYIYNSESPPQKAKVHLSTPVGSGMRESVYAVGAMSRLSGETYMYVTLHCRDADGLLETCTQYVTAESMNPSSKSDYFTLVRSSCRAFGGWATVIVCVICNPADVCDVERGLASAISERLGLSRDSIGHIDCSFDDLGPSNHRESSQSLVFKIKAAQAPKGSLYTVLSKVSQLGTLTRSGFDIVQMDGWSAGNGNDNSVVEIGALLHSHTSNLDEIKNDISDCVSSLNHKVEFS